MKTRILSIVLFALVPVLAPAQTAKQSSYYAVIGAFAKIDNAIRYTAKANKNNFSAQYAIHSSNKLYYVYILETPDLKKAYAFLIKIRAETEYKDCWLYLGKLGEETTPVVVVPVVEKPPVVEEKKDTVVFEPVVAVVDSATIKKPEEVKPPVKKPEGKPFLFKLVNAESGNEVVGEVHLQESKRATQYQAFRGNEIAYLKAPANKEGTYVLVTNAPGYQQVQMTVTFKDPGGTAGSEGEAIIPIELQKAKRGDYIDFNNVHFIRNSSIMTPGSQNELDGLVALMKENTKYKIKIHGHCNGTQTREIIVRGTSDKFFEMDPGKNKKETASDNELSDERANAVKAYMMSQGIEEKRISTKAEGGKAYLYPEGSTLSSYNDRVEVEVKKN